MTMGRAGLGLRGAGPCCDSRGRVQAVAAVLAQAPNPNAPANFIKLQAPVIALTHATRHRRHRRAGARNQTLVIRDGSIADSATRRR